MQDVTLRGQEMNKEVDKRGICAFVITDERTNKTEVSPYLSVEEFLNGS